MRRVAVTHRHRRRAPGQVSRQYLRTCVCACVRVGQRIGGCAFGFLELYCQPWSCTVNPRSSVGQSVARGLRRESEEIRGNLRECWLAIGYQAQLDDVVED
eukprot:657997-Prorocentrum_minimum.AAC.1